jgi:hypothetical protein
MRPRDGLWAEGNGKSRIEHFRGGLVDATIEHLHVECKLIVVKGTLTASEGESDICLQFKSSS